MVSLNVYEDQSRKKVVSQSTIRKWLCGDERVHIKE